MLEPVFTFFDKLIDQFSWRRLIVALLLAALFALCVVTYEAYTGAFRLQRLERVLSLVEHMQRIAPQAGVKDNLDAVTLSASQELLDFSATDSTAFSIPSSILKGIAALAPWFLVLLLILVAPGGGTASAIGGMIVVATPAIILGALLPDFRYPWINYILYPICQVLVLVSGVLLWQRRKRA